jgi:ABC-2 type transport system ATP-binding protein
MELAKLSVCLGKREILTDLSVELSGRTIGLLGPNGAGKSTLILTLLGFCPVTRGTARVLGHDIRRHIKQVSALVGYMPENDSFIADMTAVSFVRMMGELSGLPAESALERAHEVLF